MWSPVNSLSVFLIIHKIALEVIIPFPISWACYHCYQDVEAYEQLARKIISKNVSGALPCAARQMHVHGSNFSPDSGPMFWLQLADVGHTTHGPCVRWADLFVSVWQFWLWLLSKFGSNHLLLFLHTSFPPLFPPLLWKFAVGSEKECLGEIVGHHVKLM